MEVVVQTGHTKSTSGLSLVSLNMQSAQGEQVILLLQVQASAQEAKTLEKECAMVVKQSLLETEGEAGARLDGSLKEINGLLKGLLVSKSIDDVHAIVAIVGEDNVLHVSHAGRAEAYIVRGGTASQITEYTKGKPTPAFVHIASGATEPHDTVIFSTQRLLRSVTPAQLAKLAQRGDQLLDELKMALEGEKEKASLAIITVEGRRNATSTKRAAPVVDRAARRRGTRRGKSLDVSGLISSISERLPSVSFSTGGVTDKVRSVAEKVTEDLKNPQRKKRTHLLLLAGAVAVFLVVWAAANLLTSGQHSQTRAELEALVEQIDADITTAGNRYLTGDTDSANAILQRAEDQAKQVMDNESGLFRMEALDLLDRIRLKEEEINNIVRLSPRVAVNLTAKNPDVVAYGLIGLGEGELMAYDRQDLYRIILNAVDEPERLSDEELIIDASRFERMQTLLFQMTGNSVIEIISGQATSMKTEDPAGWIEGQALGTYLRFLYVLSPENNQIYKYERLSNRYAAPAEYNVNGDLSGGLDLTIDGNIFVLKDGGTIVKLFRGEVRPFVIRHLPEGALETATKIFKVTDGNIYLLDPEGMRVIVVTDGGATGESSYVRQYVLEGDQVGELKDLYVDPDQLRLYVLDEKRVYSIDLEGR